jgi:hypothetical protein
MIGGEDVKFKGADLFGRRRPELVWEFKRAQFWSRLDAAPRPFKAPRNFGWLGLPAVGEWITQSTYSALKRVFCPK